MKLQAFPNSYRLPTLSIYLLTNISPINQTTKSASLQYSRTCYYYFAEKNVKKQTRTCFVGHPVFLLTTN